MVVSVQCQSGGTAVVHCFLLFFSAASLSYLLLLISTCEVFSLEVDVWARQVVGGHKVLSLLSLVTKIGCVLPLW